MLLYKNINYLIFLDEIREIFLLFGLSGGINSKYKQLYFNKTHILKDLDILDILDYPNNQ